VNSVNRRLTRRGWIALSTAGLVVGASVLAVATANGAGERAAVAALDVSQTCSRRVQPNSKIEIQAVVANTGDVVLTIPSGRDGISADAGTPVDESDDFVPTFAGGDTNGNGSLDPGERWTYNGSYTGDAEDIIDIVGVEAFGAAGEAIGDIAACETDVVQKPQPGEIVGVSKVSGTVMVKEPDSSRFVPLTGVTEIPVGSQVDTTRGTIRLVAGLGGGRTNSANFNDGLFEIAQKHARNAYMTLALQGGNFGVCRGRALSAASVDAKRKRPVRRLWGNGKGRFTTKGRYSSATVRGTRWLVQDRCDGTLTRVLRGVVRVTDFRKHKTLNVRAGQTYLAKAP
jgi:hypothetical protein